MYDEQHDITYVPESDKEAGFKYRWLNTNERHLRQRQYEGWQLCVYERGENPLLNLPGQATETPAAGVLRQRGDLVLARMPLDLHDQKYGKRIREARERQQSQVTQSLESVNDQLHAAARAAGLSKVPKQLVFRDDPTN